MVLWAPNTSYFVVIVIIIETYVVIMYTHTRMYSKLLHKFSVRLESPIRTFTA